MSHEWSVSVEEQKWPIYCINRVCDKARRSNVVEQSEEMGLDVQFVEAVEGSELTMDQCVTDGYSRSRRTRSYVDLHWNELACALSHKKALKNFLDGGDKFCIVLEDDAKYSPNFIQGVNTLIEQAKGWDLVKLECRSGIAKGYVFQPEIAGMQLYAGRDSGLGTTGLLYSRVGAQKVFDSLSSFTLPVDNHIGVLWSVRTIGVVPSLVEERHDDESTVEFRTTFIRKSGVLPHLIHRCHRFKSSFVKRLGICLTRKSVTVSSKGSSS